MRAARVVLILVLLAAAAGAVYFAAVRLGYLPNVFASAPARRLAPAGTVYALTYSSFTVTGGVIGIEAGQKLKLVEDRGSSLVVDDGKYRGEIPVQNVTDDLDLAALAGRRDAASQAQLQQALAVYRAEAARHESPFQPRVYYVPRPAPKQVDSSSRRRDVRTRRVRAESLRAGMDHHIHGLHGNGTQQDLIAHDHRGTNAVATEGFYFYGSDVAHDFS